MRLPLRRLMCNEPYEQVLQVAQRSAERVFDRLGASVGRNLCCQARQQPSQRLGAVALQTEEVLELADDPYYDLALASRGPASISTLGLYWQAPDHSRGHRPAQGLLLFGVPPRQDVGRAADAPGSKGCGLHLRPTDQRLSRPTAAPPGGPARMAHCTSVVSGEGASLK